MCIDFKRFCRLLPALLLAALPAAALADGSVDSTTILRIEEDNHAGFQSKTLAPLTEFLGLDADQLGDGRLSVHLYGWGRVSLADRYDPVDGGDSSVGGALNYGFLQYRFDHANARARAGRFFISEGIVNEQVDGGSFKTDLPYGFGVSAFGGATVHTVKILGADTDGKGDAIAGGRVNYRKGGLLELGFSGVYETDAPTVSSNNFLPGTFGSHRLIGGDIWLRPFQMVQVSGHTSYNTETKGIAEHSYLVQAFPVSKLTLAASYDEQRDRSFFYSSLLFADMLRNLNQNSKAIGGMATYSLTDNVDVTADYKNYKRDVGRAERFGGEVRGNFLKNTLRTGVDYHYLRASENFAVVPVDGASGSYHAARGYVMHDTKGYFASLDLIGYFFKTRIENRNNAWETVAGLGYHLTPDLSLSGDLSYGQNPQYNDELKGLVRLTYNVKFADKGDKK
ncbi:hypothetical protein L4X63_13200 [Geomonas sp. Red32]|uniref:hypothetical protein n=1 Tax=Geomonas sp. Red32 TaxID=2912856 RepID=UPI00202D0543|nr:hypothetical protein [Geomonas sp. Red32]MCM0082550.1 hypothetical protein [Geomonas sp. Red32]